MGEISVQEKKRSFSKRMILSALLILVAIPLTIYIGWNISERQFYITSLLIIVYTMIPFFLVFEKRKPQAKELVVIAVMCAIAVVSRAAFIWLPHFKPMTAIIIITGVALGAEAGFLTGAMTGFVSNFIFGQGTVDTVADVCVRNCRFSRRTMLQMRDFEKKKRVSLCVFGGVCVMLIVGPLLDTCSLFFASSEVTKESALAIYATGLPVNAIHAVATIVTLALFSGPLLEKLDRVKMKYGMMEE
ncbi:ECF transporter S component [Eubacterium ramulus]|uniref:ECF transporter S component n=1 Tax=Eubacterium ramulus TaxID=39490 RepID=UPI00399B1974